MSVDCPGFDSRKPCGLGQVKCPTPGKSTRLSLSFERREQRLQRPRQSRVGTIHASARGRSSLSKQATCITIPNSGTEFFDISHFPLPLLPFWQGATNLCAESRHPDLPPFKNCLFSILSEIYSTYHLQVRLIYRCPNKSCRSVAGLRAPSVPRPCKWAIFRHGESSTKSGRLGWDTQPIHSTSLRGQCPC